MCTFIFGKVHQEPAYQPATSATKRAPLPLLPSLIPYTGAAFDFRLLKFNKEVFPEAHRLRIGGNAELVWRGKRSVSLFRSSRPRRLVRDSDSRIPVRDDNIVAVNRIMVGDKEIKQLQLYPYLKRIVSVSEYPYHPDALKNLQAEGIDVIQEHTKDFTSPTTAQYDRVIKAIEESVNNDNDLLLHCGGGLGRSGTYAFAYEIYKIMQKDSKLLNRDIDRDAYLGSRFEAHKVETEGQKQSLRTYATLLNERLHG